MAKIYPRNFELKIGFEQVRRLLHENCLSELGKDLVHEIVFVTDFGQIEVELAATAEMAFLIQEAESFPTSYYFDLRPSLSKIKTEGRFLEVRELFDLRRSLETISQLIAFLLRQKQETFPGLHRIAASVSGYPYVKDRIDRILTTHGKIKDQASPELATVRRDLLSKQSQVSKRLHQILRAAQHDGLIDEDASVSIRDGRPVIPVASAVKRRFDGIIHDESATGKTAFIEPSEVVELNNAIRELEYAEKREIVKILVAFAGDIRPYLDELMLQYEFLGRIDFLRAKALLANKMKAIKPVIEDSCRIDWTKAIHPLLQLSLQKENKSVVPLTIELSGERHILLISGPNAGGKSVCLKTVGLLQYMLQCGLLIPVHESSRTGVFQNIFIDIGDEQSIENDLSTYSSHLMNMKYFLKNADRQTLILIDEFGTGTEPQLGGAIAESVLAELNECGTFGVITTHYTNLKHFATSSEGIINGAMMFDVQQMEPLFQLEIGKPGSSFAFEIARKIGLSESILQKATDKIGKEHIDFDKNLRELIRDKHYWESKRQKVRQQEKKLDEVSDQYEKDLEQLKKQRQEILGQARNEARIMLEDANRKVENTIRAIREAQAEREKTRLLRKDLSSFREEVEGTNVPDKDDWINRKIEKIKRRKEQHPGEEKLHNSSGISENVPVEKPELAPGVLVKIKGQDTVGEVLEVGDKNVVIALGQLRTSVAKSRVISLSKNAVKKEKSYNQTTATVFHQMAAKKQSFKSEIDIRGQRVEEALPRIQQFLDDAIMLNVHEIRVLHGKGNGILKEVIRQFLKSDPSVQSCRDEHVQFGGSGITIIELAD